MSILETAEIYNLDSIPETAIVTATVDGARLILSKLQLFAKLRGRKARKPSAPSGKATRVKSDKA